jgi:hypothetical protein
MEKNRENLLRGEGRAMVVATTHEEGKGRASLIGPPSVTIAHTQR